MLDKLKAVERRYEELCARSEQPDFYADPKKAAKLLRERNELEPVVQTYREYHLARQDMADAQELMSDPEMKELCQQTYQEAITFIATKCPMLVMMLVTYVKGIK